VLRSSQLCALTGHDEHLPPPGGWPKALTEPLRETVHTLSDDPTGVAAPGSTAASSTPADAPRKISVT
jgi:hypothetical protein